MRIAHALDHLIVQPVLRVRAGIAQTRHAIDHVDGEGEAVDLIVDREFQRRVDVALLLVAAHVHVVVIGAAVGELVNQPRIRRGN